VALSGAWPGEAARAEQDAWFEDLVRTHGSKVRSLVYRLVGGEAEDLVQDVFVQVYRSLPGFRGEAQVSTWLYRIATNRCLDYLRRHRRTEGKVISLENCAEEHSLEPLAVPLASPEARTVAVDLRREIRRCLAALPADLRAVVVLRDLEGLEYREIAAVLGLPLGTVQSRLHRGRNLLRDKLGPYLEG
jgi:RNA polymerase sigma-70 factor (ECF subfamily)